MSIGHAAYLTVGAYVAARLNIFLGVNYLLALVVAAVATAVVAVITVLPLLRLSTFYFAFATLGLNVVVVDTIHNVGPRVRGTEGRHGVTLPPLFDSPEARLGLALALTVLSVLFTWRVVHSPCGRSVIGNRRSAASERTRAVTRRWLGA